MKLIKDAEISINDGASLKLGPLDFTIRIELLAPKPDGTPLPTASPETAAALAAVKAATAGAGVKAATPLRDATPNPARSTKPGGSKEAPRWRVPKKGKCSAHRWKRPRRTFRGAMPKLQCTATVHLIPSLTPTTTESPRCFLGMDDSPSVPDGSTVIDAPAVDSQGQPVSSAEGKPDDKNGKKPVQSREDMSNAASEALRRMMRRPK